MCASTVQLFLVICPCICATASERGEWFTLIHTNDILSHFDEAGSTQCPHEGRCFGGIPRLIQVIREEKQKHKNVMVVDAGGMFNTELVRRPSAEKLIKELVSRAGYDVISPALAEYFGGAHLLNEYIGWYEGTDTNVVCTNMDYQLNGKNATRCKKWAVVTMEGLRVGVISWMNNILASELPVINVTDVWVDGNPNKFDAYLNHLYYKEKVDIVIGLFNAFSDVDQAAAKLHPMVNIFITAHHKGLAWNNPVKGPANEKKQAKVGPRWEIVSHPYPYEISMKNGKKVYVVTASHNLHYAGLIRFKVESRTITDFEATNPVFLDGTKDLQAEHVMETLRPDQEAFLGGLLGATGYILDAGRRCSIQECAFGNIIADAVLERVTAPNYVHGDGPLIGWSKVTAALVSSSHLYSIPLGNIYREDVRMAYYHYNRLMIMDVKGEQLLHMLQSTAKEFASTELSQTLQISGMRMTIDQTAAEGQKVSDIYVVCSVCIVASSVHIDELHTYRIVTTDYLVQWSPQRHYFANMVIVNKLPITVYDALVDYISRTSPLARGVEHRIHVKPRVAGLDLNLTTTVEASLALKVVSSLEMCVMTGMVLCFSSIDSGY